jgi:hopanoid biosynthesis associated RND transporter like protein HpnN
MKNRIDEVLARGLTRWVDGVRVRARAIVWGISVLTAVLAVYTLFNLGINSDNVRLVPDDLPSRQAHDAFIAHFPNLEEAMFVVIDAETPELAREAAADLAEALSHETDVLTEVYLPGAGAFFDRNGLLYRDLDELDDFADQMARIQPLITELEADPSIAHMASIVQEGLEAVSPGEPDAEDWRLVLDRLSEATVRAWDEYPVAVSWEEVLLRGSALDVSRRRAIVVHPVLEYDHVLQARRPMARIREVAERLGYTPERGVTVRITGNPALNYDEMMGFVWDIGGAGVFCLLLVAFVLHRAMRSMRLVAATLVTLLVGLVWTAAFTAASIGTLNPLSITFAILFIGLGVDFGIHVCTGYADGLRDGASHEQALRQTAARVGSALAFCTLTTSIGFYVFVPTEYRGVAELGLIAGTGMFVIFALTMTLLPALLCTSLRLDPARDLNAPVRFQRDVFRRLGAHPAAVRRVALVAGIVAGIASLGVRFDVNVVEMRDPDTESVQAFQDLLSDPLASPWYLNVLMPDLASAEALAERVVDVPEIGHAVTLASFVPEDQEEKVAILSDVAFLYEAPIAPADAGAVPDVDEQVAALRALRDYLDQPWLDAGDTALAASMVGLREHLDRFLARLDAGDDPETALADLERVLLEPLPELLARLRRALEAEPFGIADLPAPVVRRMVTADGTARVQVYPESDMNTADELDEFVLAVVAATPNAAGVPLNLYEFGQVTSRSFTQALVSAVVIISLLLYLLWRRLTEVLLVMAPLFLGASLTAATAVLFDIRFNFTNVVVIPLLFGIGVDSAIHLVQRANEGGPDAAALMSTPTARAVYYSAVTTMVSFGSLALAGHNGVESLGILLTTGLVYTVLSVLVVLPALLDWRDGPPRPVPARDARPVSRESHAPT